MCKAELDSKMHGIFGETPLPLKETTSCKKVAALSVSLIQCTDEFHFNRTVFFENVIYLSSF